MASEGFLQTAFSQLIAEGALEIGDGYRAKNEELGGDGLIFLRAGHVSDTHIDFGGVERFHAEHEPRVRSKLAKPGDTVVTTKGNSTGRTTFVAHWMPPFVYSPHLSYWRSLDPDRIEGGFLRYWCKSREFTTQLSGMKASTDMAPYLSLMDQRRLEITLPPIDEQRAIANILGTLDDKIELNRRMNETLEAMALALFNSWFVDFDPVRAKANGRDPGLPKPLADLFPSAFEDSELGEIPRGWEVGSIGKVADVIDCVHSRKPDRLTEGLPLLQLSNIRDDGLIDMEDTYFIDEQDYVRWISRMEASPGDCLITNVGRVGAVAQMPAGLKAALGRNMTGLRCRSSFPNPTFLIECLLSQAMRDEFVLKTDTGTILDALNVRSIPALRFVYSSSKIPSRFEEVARPLRGRMEQNLRESRTLATLRDTLLPKLISGELRIADAGRVIERATA
jgi:type I restriction enzyme S subunit